MAEHNDPSRISMKRIQSRVFPWKKILLFISCFTTKIMTKNLQYHQLYKDRPRDMHVIERKRPSRIKIFLTIFSVFFLLAGVTLYAGYRVFNTYFSQRDELSISLRIDGPTEVSAGEEASYTVRYKNPSGTKLTNMSIVANYSSGFVNITSDEYESTSQQTADMQKTWSTWDVSG